MTRILALFTILVTLFIPSAFAQDASTFYANPNQDKKLGLPVISAPFTENEMMGQAVWYMSAPNSRYHHYVFPQKIGGGMNFWKMLRTDRRYDDQDPGRLGRYSLYGMMNDPDCCSPGKDCQERAKEPRFVGTRAETITRKDTFGLDYCIGDDDLLAIANGSKPARSYEDPACKAPFNDCALEFGQATGVIGFRKFPNPRFNKEKWSKLNNGRDNWNGWEENIKDFSNEPPFLIGMSCASCHATHNPVNPAENPERPEWANLRGAFGAQYNRTSEIHSSALASNNILRQMFRSRPGITDTSAAPHDATFNPGSFLSVINFDKKPVFPEKVKIDIAYDGDGVPSIVERDVAAVKNVHRILKGGEDSTGAYEAVQRVYVNIGACSEQCWVNHLSDLTVIDYTSRNFLQTPFQIKQCFEDCASFRAITKQLPNIGKYLFTRRPTDLMNAEVKNEAEVVFKATGETSQEKREELMDFIETKLVVKTNHKTHSFKEDDVLNGRTIFAQKCASCHSTAHTMVNGQGASPEGFDFTKHEHLFWSESPETGHDRGVMVRNDWLGNDIRTPAAQIDNNRCRSLHSNHKVGHVWEQYGSDTLQSQPQQTGALDNDPATGGQGYYRNISLLSVWATAPLLHNNAVGPEICGKEGHQDELYRDAYDRDSSGNMYFVDGGTVSADAAANLKCRDFDHSVLGRIGLFLDSMDNLLYPETRVAKVTRMNEDVVIGIGPKMFLTKRKDSARVVEADSVVEEKKKTLINRLFKKTKDISKSAVKESLNLLGRVFKYEMKQFELVIPKGTSAALIGNLDTKAIMVDVLYMKATGEPKSEKGKQVKRIIANIKDNLGLGTVLLNAKVELAGGDLDALLLAYNTCTDKIENKGHRFGEDLSDEEKQSLKAFLLTL